jgi:hypothetical protein
VPTALKGTFSTACYSTNLDGSDGKTSALLGNLTGIVYAELPVATQKAVSIMRGVREL